MPNTLEAALARSRAERRTRAPAQRRLLRIGAGLSQATVAAALGVTQPTIARWERGRRRPRGALAAAYATLLDRLAAEVVNGNEVRR